MESDVAGGSWVSIGEKGKSQVKRAKATARTTKTTGKMVDQSDEAKRGNQANGKAHPETSGLFRLLLWW